MHFQILPTTRCNARCFYCYELNQTYEDMSESTINDMVSLIENTATTSDEDIRIDWFGGEPLLAVNTIESVSSELKKRLPDKQIIQTIVTNGSLITETICDKLKKIGISNIQITLDGKDKCYDERKNYYNRNNRFETVIENIELCNSFGFNVIIRINVDKKNHENCAELIDYLNQRFKNSVRVYVAPLYGTGIDYLDKKDVYQVLKQLKSKIQYPQKPRNNQWGMCLNKQNNNIFIKPNGDIIRCEHMFANTDAVIGNVRSGIKKVENNICIGCDYYKICKYGCICLSSCEGCWRSN